jgi:hypothetical protein
MKLGKLAVWTIFSTFDARSGAAFAQRIERWGYDAIWIKLSPGASSVLFWAYQPSDRQLR